MRPQQNNHELLARRDFVLAALLFPLFVNASMTDFKTKIGSSLSTDSEADFVILGGWVFLKSDLIGNMG